MRAFGFCFIAVSTTIIFILRRLETYSSANPFLATHSCTNSASSCKTQESLKKKCLARVLTLHSLFEIARHSCISSISGVLDKHPPAYSGIFGIYNDLCLSKSVRRPACLGI